MSETNLEQFREVTPVGRFTLQNSSLLKVRLDNDSIQAKLGSMVAYQGDVRFEYQSGGLGRFFKKALTGEGVKLMSAAGHCSALSDHYWALFRVLRGLGFVSRGRQKKCTAHRHHLIAASADQSGIVG